MARQTFQVIRLTVSAATTGLDIFLKYRIGDFTPAWQWQKGMEHTFGLGGGGEKLTWGLLITPSDMDAVAKAKCLLLLPQPLLVMTGSSIG